MKKPLGFLLAVMLLANGIHAAGPFTVNTPNDTHDSNTGDGVANDGTGHASLRAAVEQASASGGTTTINLPAGTYNLSLGDLNVGSSAGTTIYLHGTGTTATTTIHQTQAGRMVFDVNPTVSANVVFILDNVTVTGGSENELDPDGFGGNGGAMLAGGSTTAPGNVVSLTNVVFSGNYCSPSANAGASGGAISMTGGGNLNIFNCTFSGNDASKFSGTGYGGAIYFDAGFAGGNVVIQNSTFANNTAHGGQAGAIYLAGGTGNTYTLTGNTFTGNIAGASAQGGAIYLATGNLTANFNRITGNTAGTGSGLYMSTGTNPPRWADVRNNWWGANGGPAGGAGDDSVSPTTSSSPPPANGQITFDPWIVLKATANPNPILVNGATTVTASLLQNSAGGSLTAGQISALIGLPVTWANSANGTPSGQQTTIQSAGTATATFTAGTTPGVNIGKLEAKVDNVQNGDTTATASITIYQLPLITSANATTFLVGASGSFTVTDTGFPTPNLSLSGALPSGVTFNPGTGILSGTPGAGTGGTWALSITATNLVGTNTQSFTLTVNQAATIGSANQATFIVGNSGSFAVTASGFPAPSLNESGSLPTGVSFTNANGLLAGTPAPGTGGIYPISFTAHNGVGADGTQNFTLTVDDAAAITSANHVIFTVGSAGSFTVTATGFPAPTFVESGALPNGIGFNTNSGVLSGTPANGTGGSYLVTFAAHNGVGGDATQNFTLTINRPPIPGSTFTLGADMGVPATVKIVGGKHAPTDPDTDPLTITSVAGGIHGLVSTDGTNVTYTATNGTADSFTCTLSDGRGGTASQTVNVSITPASSTGFNQLSAQSLGNGTNVLTFLGTPGFNYALESTTNLAPPVVWQPQVTNHAAANGWLIFTNVTTDSPVFYRTRYVP